MRFIVALSALALFACTTAPFGQRDVAGWDQDDPYLWLEDVEGARSIEFANAENAKTFAALQSRPEYAGIESDIRRIVLAQDRLPSVTLRNGRLYNFWQDGKNVRGLWRRTTVDRYRKDDVEWETILDLDRLAADEGENWVWKGASCLPPENRRCLITLSRGGKDAAVVREFDAVDKAFVKGGFELPENKSTTEWISRDEIFVGTDFGTGTMSESGYPIVSKRWKRGTPLAAAKEVLRGEPKDMWVWSSVVREPGGSTTVHGRAVSFFEYDVWIETAGGRVKSPFPSDAKFQTVFADHVLFLLTSDLKTRGRTFARGSLVALPIARLAQGDAALDSVSLVFAPSKKVFLEGVSRTKSALLLSVLDNVRGRLLKVTRGGGRWKSERLPVTGNGVVEVASADAFDDDFLTTSTDFLTPASFSLGNARRSAAGFTKLKSAPARFDSKNLTSEQFEATSADGTKVPYFIVHRKDMVPDGKNPTLLYGYGGFEVAMTPFYLNSAGKVWAERGGAYVLANIRGGGEFGPAWHKAAQRENRQRAFDDFIAVAEDLVKRKITSPAHLGIQGGSNGGLLTGAVFVQRPDLFNAVLVEVPLLDMIRYNKLLAGASWVDEYGNPEDPKMREVLLKYSPYQNVRADVKYPEAFFLTSTKDDRVHPGHARKMVARMREQGHPIYYYENTEGGHGGSANLEQRIRWSSLEMTYLWMKLAR